MILDMIDPDNDGPPQVGDVVVTARLVRIITEVRPVESRIWHDRWHLTLQKVGPVDPWPTEALAPLLADGVRVHRLGPLYRRGEGPADVARSLGLPVRSG